MGGPAYDLIATWNHHKDGILEALCSCTGVQGIGRSYFLGLPMVLSQMEAALARSCTCRRATALLGDHDVL